MNNTFLVKAGYEDYFKTNTMRIIINVTDICNFSCSYCINPEVKQQKRILDPDILKNFIEDLGKRKCDSYYFTLSGGEPLLYPHLDLLLDCIDEYIITANKKVQILTNGSLLLKRKSLLSSYIEKLDIGFTISIHLEQIKRENLLSIIKNFKQPDRLKCKILFTPGSFTKSKELIDLLSPYQIPTYLSVIISPQGTPYQYTEQELHFLKTCSETKFEKIFHEYQTTNRDHYIEYIDHIKKSLHPERLNYKGMHCCAGSHSLRLNPSGKLVRCFGFMRQKEFFDLSIQRLRDIKELSSPCVCPSTRCTCFSFTKMPKWRYPQDAPSYIQTSTN